MPHEKTLENFFGDLSAVELAETMVKRRGMYKLLALHGPSGAGKTHLLQAIERGIIDAGGTCYRKTGFEFTHDVGSSLDNLRDLHSYAISCDALLIDEVGAVLESGVALRAFEAIFDHFLAENKCVVLTSTQHFRDLRDAPTQLITRISWGVMHKLHNLTSAGLHKFASYLYSLHGLGDKLPEALFAILDQKPLLSNPRELEGYFMQLAVALHADKHEDPRVLYERVVQARDGAAKIFGRTSLDDILDMVAEEFNVLLGNILGKRRTRNYALPRHIGMYLAKELTGMTLTEIGSHFGGRDHSTVLHGINKIRTLMSRDALFRRRIEDMRAALQSQKV